MDVGALMDTRDALLIIMTFGFGTMFGIVLTFGLLQYIFR